MVALCLYRVWAVSVSLQVPACMDAMLILMASSTLLKQLLYNC